jgi:hypothetical protein
MPGTETVTLGCKHVGRDRRYQFREDTQTPRCTQCAVRYQPVLHRAVVIALIVGTILTLINQGDILLHGAVTTLVIVKICLTYTVPYTVSTISALAANRL